MTLHILILYYCIICPNLVISVLVVLLQAEHLSFATVLDVVVIIVMGAIWAIMPTDGIAIVTDWFYNRVMQVCFIHSIYIYIYIHIYIYIYHMVFVLRARTSMAQTRAFAIIGPSLWNQLLPSTRSTLLTGEPSASFCSIKTALFSLGLSHWKRF